MPSLEATTECVPCSQMGMKPITGSLEKTEPIGSEDCLILAVWRPDTDETDLPVYFWAHGGSNNFNGIANNYWGSMIASRSNMVVVFVQYRLETLGCNADEMKIYLPPSGLAVKYAYMNPQYGVTEPVPSGPYTWADQFKVVVPQLVADSSVVTRDEVTLEDIFPQQADRDMYSACNAYGSLCWRVNFVDDFARALKTHVDQPVYAYLLQWDGRDGTPYQFTWGAAHATGIPFFFGAKMSLFYGAAFSPGNDTPGRQALSAGMMPYVANFVRTNDPNGGDLPLWEEWSTTIDGPKRILWDASEAAPIISRGPRSTHPQMYRPCFRPST